MVDAFVFGAAAAVVLSLGLALAALRPAWIVDQPRTVLAVLALICLVATAVLVRISPPGVRVALDPSSAPLLPIADPGAEVYREAILDFGSDDIYVVAMATEDVFTQENLSILRRVTDRVRRLPGVRGAESLTNTYTFHYDAAQDMVDVGPLIREIPASAAALGALRARVLADPLFAKTLIARDGRTAALNVSFRRMSDGEFVRSGLDASIRQVVAEEAGPGRRFFIAGGPHVRAAGHALMVSDLLRLIPLAVLLASAVLFAMTGTRRGVVLPLGACLIATLWTFAAMVVVGIELNVITIVLAPTLICVGAVYGVHVLARYEALAVEHSDARAAALACLTYTRVPVLIAGATTCAGFAALWLTDTRATHQLGAFAVFGVACVTLLSLTFVPALLALLPLRSAGRTRFSAWLARGIDAALHRLGSALVRRPGTCIAIWAVLALVSAALVPRIVVDTDFLTFFDPASRVRTDFAKVNELLVGAVPIYVVFEGGEEGAFREPEALRALERVEQRLEQVPGVSQVISMVDLVRTANRALAGDDPAAERIPDTRPGVAEILFLIPKQKLRRFATSNHSAANIVVRTGRLGSAGVRELEADLREAVASVDTAGLPVSVTGNAILLNRSADGIARTQGLQLGVVLLTIWALVLAVFRSQRIALLAILPNVVPVLLFFGALGAGAAPLSLPTSLIGSIALGIAVDDTVHFLAAYRRTRALGLDPQAAAVESVRRVGRPIVITSVVLVVGFLALLPSGFVTLREFGLLTAMTMGICLVTDLLLLPALLVRARA